MSLGGLLTVPLPIYDSQFCDMSLPQVYCSVFNFTDAQLCSAIFGEPVVCEDPTVVNGIVLSLSCNFTLGDIFQGSLNYHSLCDFNEWIRQVSAARKTKMSVIIFAFAGLLTLKNKI